MFQLDQTIQQWRADMTQNQNVTPENIDELEGHLRDEIETLMVTGLSAEESFMVSSLRLGGRDQIAGEFAKVNKGLVWRKRSLWMLGGILISMLVGSLAGLCSQTAGSAMVLSGLDTHLPTALTITVSTAIFAFLLTSALLVMSLLVKGLNPQRNMVPSLILCALGLFLLKGAAHGLWIFSSKMFDLETLGRVAMTSAYTGIIWQLVFPVAIFTLTGVLWSLNRRSGKRLDTTAK